MHNDGAGVMAWHSNGARTAELDYAITITYEYCTRFVYIAYI